LGIFGNSKIGDVFSSAGLSAFLSMPVYKFVIFWLLLAKTVYFVYAIKKGYEKDKIEIIEWEKF
jgi:hypothetical protein